MRRLPAGETVGYFAIFEQQDHEYQTVTDSSGSAHQLVSRSGSRAQRGGDGRRPVGGALRVPPPDTVRAGLVNVNTSGQHVGA